MSFEQLVERIYQAAASPDDWPALLDDIGRTVDAPAAILPARRADDWIAWKQSISAAPSTDIYLRSEHPSKSRIARRLVARSHPGFLRDTDLATEHELQADPYMTKFVGPAGLLHAAATAISMPTGDHAVIHFCRKRRLPPLSDTEHERGTE